MKDEGISLTGPDGDFNRQMYKALIDSMDPKTRFVFLSHQIALGVEHLYPDPAKLLDRSLAGKDFVAVKLPVDVIGYIITVFNESLPEKERGAAAESFMTNIFIKGIGRMIEEIAPGGEKREWMEEVMNRLKEMIDIEEE